jgi:hypothetical protein
LTGTLPPWLIQEFTDLGVLKENTEKIIKNDGIIENTDLKNLQKKFPHGLIGYEYNHKINKNIKKSYLLYQYLENQIEIANEFYKTIVIKLNVYNNVGVKNEQNKKVTLHDLQVILSWGCSVISVAIICVVIFLYLCLIVVYVSHVEDRFFNTPRLEICLSKHHHHHYHRSYMELWGN